MKATTALLFASACAALGNQSLVLAPGTRITINTPAAEPYTTLGSTRIEMRIHDWSSVPANTSIVEIGDFGIFLFASGELCAYGTKDAAPDYGGQLCADVSGYKDVTVRWERDIERMELRWTVWDTESQAAIPSYCGSKAKGTSGNTFPCPIRNVHRTTWAGTGYLGNANVSAKLAWLKWFSGTADPNAPRGEFAAADLADWRFEGNIVNPGPGRASLGWTGALYASTPSFGPYCSAGARQAMRVDSGTLDGSGSFSRSGTAELKYSWSGPEGVTFSNPATASPVVSGMSHFGAYTFTLQVTDGENNSASCSVTHGAVPTDNQGVVDLPPHVSTLLGPLIRYGANPWPWMDDRHRLMADLAINEGNNYPAYQRWWDVPGPGTVTVTAGSKTIVGSGTSFTTDFCRAAEDPFDPKAPKYNSWIVVWYGTGNGDETGRRRVEIASCEDDTHLTAQAAWGTDVPAGSELQYAVFDNARDGNFFSYSSPYNYYDNAAALYALYYRTGWPEYLDAARDMADKVFLSPGIDRGSACGINSYGCFSGPHRSISMLGLTLRALDGKPEYWDGLYRLAVKAMYNIRPETCRGCIPFKIYDPREKAYMLAEISYCAMYDPDAGHRATCKAAIDQSFAQVWTPYRNRDSETASSWPQFMYGLASFDGMGVGTSSASLTQGSSTVNGVGTSWTQAQADGKRIWFTDTPSLPESNAGGDPVFYTAKWVSATELTLDRPYEGSSGSHGWVIEYGPGVVGWGMQPLMQGQVMIAFGLAAQALAEDYPDTAAVARQYLVEAANWVREFGYWEHHRGLYYFAGHVTCRPPISDADPACTSGSKTGLFLPKQARAFSPEVARGLGMAYLASGDTALRDLGDVLVSANYSKPGTGGLAWDGDGYQLDLDWGVGGGGWYITGDPATHNHPKWFGVFFGFGDSAAWPGYRVGGWQPGEIRTAYIGYDSTSGPSPRANFTVTAPDGRIVRSTCNASPCRVSVDGSQRNQSVTLKYVLPGGRVLSSSQIPIVVQP